MVTRSTSKYRNKKASEDGYSFDSLAELARYRELKLLLHGGEIVNLEVHPKFELWVNDTPVANYVADFSYYDRSGKKRTIEDIKGVRTQTYRLKRKMFEAQYRYKIVEIDA